MSEPTTGNTPERPVPPDTTPVDHPTERLDTPAPDTRAEPLAAPSGSAWPDAAAYVPPDGPATADLPAEPRTVPMGTLVFGLVVVALGLLILVSIFYGITLSGSAVAISLFLGAGLVLIIGGLVAARRSSGRSPSRS